jgi:Insertion element 4 transposase N-terminal/Transposase DDE domain
MDLRSSLLSLEDGTLPSSFEGLKSHVPVEWIDKSLANGGVATVRRRKLPADQVVWLVIGMALYRDRSIPAVVNDLNLVVPEADGRPGQVAKSAIPPARDRVGAEPLQDLFQTTARHWAWESADRQRWHGLMVLGSDGSTLRVPDSPENRKAFHLPGSSRGTAAYPQVRVSALMVLRSHLFLDFDLTDCRTGEGPLSWPLIQRVPDQSVTIMDRNFIDYGQLYDLQSQGTARHWLVRAKKNLKWRVIKHLGRGDDLVEIQMPAQAREQHPDGPETFRARVVRYRRQGFRSRTLLTSLLDSKAYPAAEIAELYHERWELELGYDEIKTHTLDSEETLRSETPERVRQEIWGIAIAYNLIRREMEAIAEESGVPPRRISYYGSLLMIRNLFFSASHCSPGTLPKVLSRFRLDMRQMILPPRRSDRRYPRQVKIKMSNYARNRKHPR